MGRRGPGAQDGGKCAGDSPACSAGLRAGRAAGSRAWIASSAEFCSDRRRTDGSGTRRSHCRHRAALFAPRLPAHRSAKAEATLKCLGVEVHTDTQVTAIGPGWVEAGGQRFDAVVTLWAAGVQASPLGKML